MDDSTKEWAGMLRQVVWRKSSFSINGECLSVAEVNLAGVLLQNSNCPEGGTLLLQRTALAGWIAGIKSGEFDDLVA